jgi:hypothetical protein
MNLLTRRGFAASIVAVGAATDGRAQSPREPTGVGDAIAYIRHRYGLPPGIELGWERTGVQEGAYEEIRFFSQSPMRPFEVTLYRSRDWRFLFPEVMDLRRDAVKHRDAATPRVYNSG